MDRKEVFADLARFERRLLENKRALKFQQNKWIALITVEFALLGTVVYLQFLEWDPALELLYTRFFQSLTILLSSTLVFTVSHAAEQRYLTGGSKFVGRCNRMLEPFGLYLGVDVDPNCHSNCWKLMAFNVNIPEWFMREFEKFKAQKA